MHREPTATLPVEIAFRIPGQWPGMEALAAKLPLGCRLDDRFLHLEDGDKFEWIARPTDGEFLKIFADSCHRMPSERDRQVIENYTVNFCLLCPGGSVAAAQKAMRAVAIILRAGGAGVFIDNSGLAHGSDDWHLLAADETDGGVFWAFVNFIRAKEEVCSIGMHVIGHRDAVMPRTGSDERDHMILASFLGYSYRSGITLADGEIISDPTLPAFQLHAEQAQPVPDGSPMHNPHGRWRLSLVEMEGEA